MQFREWWTDWKLKGSGKEMDGGDKTQKGRESVWTGNKEKGVIGDGWERERPKIPRV